MPAVRQAALVAAGLALAFVGFSLFVATGDLFRVDRDIAASVATLYAPNLLTAFRAIALLGGLEATTLVGLGIFAYLWREGYRLGAWAVAALPLATVVELIDKHTIVHPAPPGSLSHPDGPSLSELVEGPAGGGWSFPSGHMTRAVVVYGLLSFLVVRLARRPLARRLAPWVAIGLLLLMAFDRLYLEVHWESDVIGGVLLGATFLAASITWLEWSEARSE
jgi:undecaprenyl-diphosphatase